jgi:hypothetical protein
MSKKLLFLSPSETCDNSALLALRVVTGVSLLLKHGQMKVLHFSSMASHSLDPFTLE